MTRTVWSIGLLLIMIAGAVPARARGALFIEGHVFVDANRDGVRQLDEPGISGVNVQIVPQLTGGTLTAAVTDLLGYYLAADLAPGAYLVKAQPPAGYLCVACQARVELPADPAIPLDLALAADEPWTPEPTATPTTTPTGTPTQTATPTTTSTPTPSSTPGPTKTPAPTPTPGNATITFYVTPEKTRFPGDCATLYWWVDRATEVFLVLPGGQMGVEGAGQRQVCPETTTTYYLKVNGQNGRQETVAAQVIVPPPPTSTPVPPPKVKPTRRVSPTAMPTLTPEPTLTPAPTETPTETPTPTWTPLPTAMPEVDPLLSGLPVRWGSVEWAPSGEGE